MSELRLYISFEQVYVEEIAPIYFAVVPVLHEGVLGPGFFIQAPLLLTAQCGSEKRYAASDCFFTCHRTSGSPPP